MDEVPQGKHWQYEPKWDGFRCLVFRNNKKVELQSKSGQSLTRYFPELVSAVEALKARRFVLDSEIVVPRKRAFSFDDLLQRIHPAESRVKRLAAETPALLIVFDLLCGDDGKSLTQKPLCDRRQYLEEFARKYLRANKMIRVSPATTRIAEARKWLKQVGTSLDGIIAKRRDMPYESGNRHGMQKIKNYRSPTAWSVVFAITKDGARSVRFCSACTMSRVCSTTSASPPRSRATRKRHSRQNLKNWSLLPASPAINPAAQAVGRRNVRRSGSRLSRSLWSRSVTTTSVGAVFVTARSCCAGDRTRRRGNAPWTRSIRRKRIW